MVEKNLTIAFGPAKTTEQKAERRRLIRENYRRTVLTFLEFIQASVRDRDIVVDIDGADNVLPLVQAGPTLMVTGHIGNWEAFGVLLVERNLLGAMIAKPIHNRLIQKRVLHQRRSIPGVEIILTTHSMKAVVQCVREGRHVGFVADQDARRHGLFVPFFGRPASTARGPATFAYRLQLPLIPMFMVRIPEQQLRLRLVIGNPIFSNPDRAEDLEVERMTREHTAQLEAVIRNHPADYFWIHNRWKSRPRETPDSQPPSPQLPGSHPQPMLKEPPA
jgi:KDO2-lipid IV(A) lauroyltransferase